MKVSASGAVESELLHTYSQVDPLDVLVLGVRLAVLVAVTLTVPVVLFPVSSLRAGQGVRDITGFSFHLNLVILMTLRRTKVPSDLRSDQKKCPCLNGH